MHKQPTMLRLLADEMLMRLGRWLRAAGHDVAMLPDGTPDARLVSLARAEQRKLITRDRKMLEYRDADTLVICLHANELNACALELSRRLTLDWLYAPFSRCLLCNRPLIAGDVHDLARIPEESRRFNETAWRCEDCNKVYWHGSHVERMRRQLEAWKELSLHDST